MALSSLFTPTIDLPTFIKSLREQIDSDEFSSEMRLLGKTLKEKGRSTITNVHYLERGYENLVENLQNLGISIQEVLLKDQKVTSTCNTII